jgi:Fic family protein
LDAKAAVEFSALGQDSGLGGIFDEAFYSSALEGATTTRRIAADLIRRVRRPNDKSEWMTFNNHRMLRAVYDTQGEPLTPATVLEFHRILTEGTLDNPSDCGRLRQTDDIRVLDENGRELHKPPLAAELSKRLENLCDFANGKKPDYFIHPAIRAMLLHFKLAYDHPFVDGNGRTARGLFYWAMERAGYGFVKHASISRILTDAPALYSRAFLYTETDGNDATYFLMHQRRILRRAVSNTLVYLRKKTAERDRVKEALNHARIRGDFNHRQIALLEHALRYPDYHYFMEGHRAAHGISYQTARNDVQALEKAGLLRQIKARGAGGRRYYVASPKLIAELEKAP